MRILGICPVCGAKDMISRSPLLRSPVYCESCGMIWKDWLEDFIWPQKEKGRKMIAVEVSSSISKGFVELSIPGKSQVPFANMIVSTLNAALITRFHLRVCLATEGGIQGAGFELRNCACTIGLYSKYGQSEKLYKVLGFFGDMLGYLFEEEFRAGGKIYSRGEILWLSGDKKEDGDRAWEILVAVLTRTKSKNFARRVGQQIERTQRGPFSAPYLRGLSTKEIVERFVPLP